MKRHESLLPLTHDHHHGLAHARRLNKVVGGDRNEILAAAKSFLTFFDTEATLHFDEEEELLFPLVEGVLEARELVLTLYDEHKVMRQLVEVLRDQVGRDLVDGDTIRLIARMLELHIRLEEKRLFPIVERVVAEPILDALEFRPREREGLKR